MGTVPMNPGTAQTTGMTTTPMQPTAVNSPLATTAPGAKIQGGTSTAGVVTGAPTVPLSAPTGSVPTNTGSGTGDTGLTTAPTGISSGLNLTGGSDTLLGDFQQTYGQGTGSALAGVLGNLGSATDAAVESTNAGILQAANQQYANIQATQAAHGVSADSSTAALAAGDFNAQVNQGIQSTDAGMQLNEENTLISALQNEGTAHGTDVSTLDNVMTGITDAGQIAGSVGSAIAGGGFGGTLGNVGDILSGL